MIPTHLFIYKSPAKRWCYLNAFGTSYTNGWLQYQDDTHILINPQAGVDTEVEVWGVI